MKKTLSLLCAACIAVGMQAQTYMVNDFESGLNGANAAWAGSSTFWPSRFTVNRARYCSVRTSS